MTPARKHYRGLGLHVTGVWTAWYTEAPAAKSKWLDMLNGHRLPRASVSLYHNGDKIGELRGATFGTRQ